MTEQKELLIEVQQILENEEIEVNEDYLIEVIEENPDDYHPNSLAYIYLVEIDGSMTEEEAREIAYF